MKCAAGRKNYAPISGIRIANDACLLSARCIIVSRGAPGWFSVYLETIHGERLRVSADLSFSAANALKERYQKRRDYLQHNHARKRA